MSEFERGETLRLMPTEVVFIRRSYAKKDTSIVKVRSGSTKSGWKQFEIPTELLRRFTQFEATA